MVDELFHQMTTSMWVTPAADAALACHQKARDIQDTIDAASTPSVPSQPPHGTSSGTVPPAGTDAACMSMQEALFDPDKILCCAVESGHTLVHGSGGRGYGLGAMAVSSGCYQWKVCICPNILCGAMVDNLVILGETIDCLLKLCVCVRACV